MMRYQKVPVTICFNKSDLLEETELEQIEKIYENCGFPVIFTSTKKQHGIEPLKNLLKDKTSAVAGPSGVGKWKPEISAVRSNGEKIRPDILN